MTAIDEADRILLDAGDETRWPQSPEARGLLAYAKGYLTETLDQHARLLNGSLDPSALYDPDLGYEGTVEQAATQIAEERAEDAAKALLNLAAGYQRREAAGRAAA